MRFAIAQAVAWMVEPNPCGERQLADPIDVLLQCRTAKEVKRRLQSRKIPWEPDPGRGWLDDDTEIHDDLSDDEPVASEQQILRSALSNVKLPLPAPATSTPVGDGTTTSNRAPRPPLPDLNEVTPLILQPAPSVGTTPGAGGGGGGWTSWTARTFDETEDDRALGRHAEELVRRQEHERVVALGMDPTRVVWTSEANPAADHDIRSVDADGEDIWIEVKATTGRSGRFSWSGAEFRLAIQTRDRYVIYRVYEAHTLTPTIVEVRDPIGQLQAGRLSLNLDSLTVDVGRLGTGHDH